MVTENLIGVSGLHLSRQELALQRSARGLHRRLRCGGSEEMQEAPQKAVHLHGGCLPTSGHEQLLVNIRCCPSSVPSTDRQRPPVRCKFSYLNVKMYYIKHIFPAIVQKRLLRPSLSSPPATATPVPPLPSHLTSFLAFDAPAASPTAWSGFMVGSLGASPVLAAIEASSR